MKGSAYCYGAATIINGIATGKGAAFGIGLRTDAHVKLTTEPGVHEVTIKGDEDENTKLAKYCVLEVLNKLGLANEYGTKIYTESDIPISRGLKSSSAAANAIALSTLDALGETLDDLEIINLGIDAALKAKVSLTGAFDDACATYFGSVVVTDNIKRKILTQYSIDKNYAVIIHVPEQKIKKIDIDTSKLKGISEALEIAHNLALKKNYLEALRINGLTYGTAMELNNEIAAKALEAGAVTAGITGTGPATVILAEPEKKDEIISALGSMDKILCTTINRKKAGFSKLEN